MASVIEAQEAIAKYLRERDPEPLNTEKQNAKKAKPLHQQKEYLEVVHFDKDGKKPCRTISPDPKSTTNRSLVTCIFCKNRMND